MNSNLTDKQLRTLGRILNQGLARTEAEISEQVKTVVLARAELKRGAYTINEPSVDLGGGIEISLEGMAGKDCIPIVRMNGAVVYHGFSSEFTPGEWLKVLRQAADEGPLTRQPTITQSR